MGTWRCEVGVIEEACSDEVGLGTGVNENTEGVDVAGDGCGLHKEEELVLGAGGMALAVDEALIN